MLAFGWLVCGGLDIETQSQDSRPRRDVNHITDWFFEIPTMKSDDSSAQESEASGIPPSPPRVRFEDLSKGGVEVVIEYGGLEYRLRSTRRGGLVLNK